MIYKAVQHGQCSNVQYILQYTIKWTLYFFLFCNFYCFFSFSVMPFFWGFLCYSQPSFLQPHRCLCILCKAHQPMDYRWKCSRAQSQIHSLVEVYYQVPFASRLITVAFDWEKKTNLFSLRLVFLSLNTPASVVYVREFWRMSSVTRSEPDSLPRGRTEIEFLQICGKNGWSYRCRNVLIIWTFFCNL